MPNDVSTVPHERALDDRRLPTQTNVPWTDSHAHVIAMGRRLIAERHSAPSRETTAAEYLDILGSHGMGRGLLAAPSFYGDDNSVLLEALDHAPDRLRGTVIVEPDISFEALREMDKRNVVGVRLNWIRRDRLPDIAASAYKALFAKVRDLDWHIEIYLEGPKLASVLPVILETGVKTVVDHFGSPDPSHGIDDKGFQVVLQGLSGGHTWVKLSGYFRLGDRDPRAYAQALLAAGTADRLLFGSDWPWVGHEAGKSYQECLDHFASWIDDPRDRERILGTTPQQLFKFPAADKVSSHGV